MSFPGRIQYRFFRALTITIGFFLIFQVARTIIQQLLVTHGVDDFETRVRQYIVNGKFIGHDFFDVNEFEFVAKLTQLAFKFTLLGQYLDVHFTQFKTNVICASLGAGCIKSRHQFTLGDPTAIRHHPVNRAWGSAAWWGIDRCGLGRF